MQWANIETSWLGPSEVKDIQASIPPSSEYIEQNAENISNSCTREILEAILRELDNWKQISSPQQSSSPQPGNPKRKKKKSSDDDHQDLLTSDTSSMFYQMKQEEVDLASVLAIFAFILHDKSDSIDDTYKKILVSQIYTKMLCLEGATSYRVFNSFILQTSLSKVKKIVQEEKGKILTACKHFMTSFGKMLTLYPLGSHPDVISHIIENLIEMEEFEHLEALLLPHLHGVALEIFEIMLNQLFPTFLEKKASEKAIQFIKKMLLVVQGAETSVHNALQSLAMKFSSLKAQQRSQGSIVISKLFLMLSQEARTIFIDWLGKFSRNTKSNYRLQAVDITCVLLEVLLDNPELEEQISALFLILMARTSDKASTVRTKALSSFVGVLEEATKNEQIGTYIKHLFDDEEEYDLMDQEVESNVEEEITGLIGQRINDPSPTVRKTAIQFIEYMSILNPKLYLKPKYLDLFLRFAADTSLANRKQTLVSLANLIKSTSNFHVVKTWIIVNMVLVFDVETSVSEKAIEYAQEHFFGNLSTNDDVFWSVVSSLEPEVVDNIKKVMSSFGSKKTLSATGMKHVQNRLKNHMNVMNLWKILDEYAFWFPKNVNHDLILKEENEWSLSILAKVSKGLSTTEKEPLCTKIYDALKKYETKYIASYVKILVEISDIKLEPLMDDVTNKIHGFVIEKKPVREDVLVKYIQTIGEISMIGVKVPNRLSTLMQALASEKLDIFPATRAHTWLCLGKMSLVDISIAKHTIPLFVTELEKSTEEIVRNNILIIMCDLTVKYTSLCDRYVNKLSECLNDSSDLVKRTAAILITQLLAEDFIKWRPILFVRFSILISDSNEKVVRAAEYALSLMLTKNQNLLFNNFLELIFVLNGIKHPVYNKIHFGHVVIAGQEHVKKRYTIYKYLLDKMTMDQRLKIHGRFHTDVLIEFVDSNQVLDKYLVSDVLAILSSREMRFNKSTIEENFEEVEQDVSAQATLEQKLEQTKGKLLNKVIKKHIAENVIPIIVELKRTLEKQQSPLLKNIMEYLKLIMSDYKTEMKDIFAADPQLGKELEFDLRKLKMDKKFVYQSPFQKTPFKSPLVPINQQSVEKSDDFKVPATPTLKSKEKQTREEDAINLESVSKDLFADKIVEDKENKTVTRKRTRKQK